MICKYEEGGKQQDYPLYIITLLPSDVRHDLVLLSETIQQ